MLTLLISAALTVQFNQVIIIPSCCPVVMVVTMRAVPMLVVPMPAAPVPEKFKPRQFTA